MWYTLFTFYRSVKYISKLWNLKQRQQKDLVFGLTNGKKIPIHTWKQSSLVLTTVTVVLLCFMETPKIILLTEAIISKWTCIRCLRLFRVVEVGLRGFPLVSTTVLGIRVFVINSDRNLSIECSVSGSIFDRFVRT